MPSHTPKRAKRRRNSGKSFEALVALQARLRAPDGCPWDREQNHASLRTFLLEETYEVLEALDDDNPRKLTAELGDLLLQIIFHAELAREEGRFDIRDVIEQVHAKMVRRHPHVFGNMKARTSAEVLKNWPRLKAEERKAESEKEEFAGTRKPDAGGSILEDVPRTLPSVLEAYQLTRRASQIGFDWDHLEDLLKKLQEESVELRDALGAKPSSAPGDVSAKRAGRSRERAIEEEIGDLLFVAVNVARFLGADPEIALKKANRKFTARFQWMETEMARHGSRLAETSRQHMEELWEQSKDKE